jgi:hypothetical protein
MVLQKQDGGIRPILYGEIWHRCFSSLGVNVTPVYNETTKVFTPTYDNIIQTPGIRDGVSHCAKILSGFYDNLDTSDPNDPEVIIKIDISNVFNTTCRVLTLDVLSGRASRDTFVSSNTGMSFPPVRTCLTYLDILKSCVHDTVNYDTSIAKGKTGGQQGDPLEMLIFNLTIHHLWGRVLAKFQEDRAITHADDGYIKVKLSVTLQILTELKHVLKKDAVLELNVSKTSVLPKGVTAQTAFDVV